MEKALGLQATMEAMKELTIPQLNTIITASVTVLWMRARKAGYPRVRALTRAMGLLAPHLIGMEKHANQNN